MEVFEIEITEVFDEVCAPHVVFVAAFADGLDGLIGDDAVECRESASWVAVGREDIVYLLNTRCEVFFTRHSIGIAQVNESLLG